MTEEKRSTLRDVARVAGVSLKTASNAANGTGRMSDETRQHVLDVIHQLHYQVNVSARNLTAGRSHNITFILPGLSAPYLGELADNVISAATARGYESSIWTYDPLNVSMGELLSSVNTSTSDGVVLSLSEAGTAQKEDFNVPYPLVTIGTRKTYGLADRVTMDDRLNAAFAVRYLHQHGAQSLAVIGAHQAFDEKTIREANEGNAHLRLRGVLEQAEHDGWQLDSHLIVNVGYSWNIGEGFRAAEWLIEQGTHFDAILALNDQLAIGAISALIGHGLRVPQDVQVIGFDNIEEARYLQPPLSTMDSMINWTADTAVNRLIDRIEGKLEGPAELIRRRGDLIVRETTR